MTSLVSRSLEHLRKLAPFCPVDKCERWIPGANVRRDLFLLFDLVWLSMSTDLTEGQIVGIQVTDARHLAEHVEKIRKSPIARLWVACDGAIVVHSWAKVGPRGKRKIWKLTEHEMTWVRDDKGQIVPWLDTKEGQAYSPSKGRQP